MCEIGKVACGWLELVCSDVDRYGVHAICSHEPEDPVER